MTETQQLARRLRIQGERGKWWVLNCDEPIGPYQTRAEAVAAKRGIQAFLRHGHKRGFVTANG